MVNHDNMGFNKFNKIQQAHKSIYIGSDTEQKGADLDELANRRNDTKAKKKN
jgi:hypothetical protein